MFSILKSMSWVRWRILVNTLNATSGRDAVQRTSLALERLAPIALLVILVPSAIALALYGLFAGYQLARVPQQSIWFELPRILLLVGTVAAVIGPMLLPTADRTNPVRLLLLPIPARALYVSHIAGTLADPWIFLQLPLVAAIPAGLVIAGSVRTALAASITGLLLALTVIGIAAATTTVVHLIFRDRRRGEVIALILIVFVPLLGLLPSLARAERRDRQPPPQWVISATKSALSALPSELYVRAVRNSSTPGAAADVRPTAALAAVTVVVHGAGLVLFRRLMSSTGTTGSPRAASKRALWNRQLPLVSSGASAVALAMLRLVARSPRGRATLLGPLAFSTLFALIIAPTGSWESAPLPLRSAASFSMLAAFLGLVASIPISMNQFAVDGAGLTLTLLAPLSSRQILAGKAIAVGFIAVVPALVCVVVVAAASSAGSPVLWLSLAVSVVAIYIAVSPVASMLSLLLPRVVNMNSVGSGSNAHQLAGFAGMLAMALAAAPCAGLTFVAVRLLQQPGLAPLFLLAWCAAAFVMARLVFRPVERLFESRRESLALLM